MLLELALIELRVIEAAEPRSETAEGFDQSKLARYKIANKFEPHFPREVERAPTPPPHPTHHLPGGEKVRNHVTRAESRKREIAAFLCGDETAPVPDAATM